MLPDLDAIIADSERAAAAKTVEGRPSKLTRERMRTVLGWIIEGAPITTAAQAAGIVASTWRDWCEQHPRLRELAQQAETVFVQEMVSEIRGGIDIKGQPDWKARAWLLERRRRDEFAAPKQMETVVNVNNNTLNVTLDMETLTKLQEAHRAAAAAIADQRAKAVAIEG